MTSSYSRNLAGLRDFLHVVMLRCTIVNFAYDNCFKNIRPTVRKCNILHFSTLRKFYLFSSKCCRKHVFYWNIYLLSEWSDRVDLWLYYHPSKVKFESFLWTWDHSRARQFTSIWKKRQLGLRISPRVSYLHVLHKVNCVSERFSMSLAMLLK